MGRSMSGRFSRAASLTEGEREIVEWCGTPALLHKENRDAPKKHTVNKGVVSRKRNLRPDNRVLEK
jgi:hypothetical protein